MLPFELIFADASSWFDPDWWFDRLGVLGVIVAMFGIGFRYLLPDLRALVRSHTELADALKINVPQQTKSLQRIEDRQEDHGKQLAAIDMHLRPRGA